MRYIANILLALDRLGNAITAGNSKNTISGRTGYFAIHSSGLRSCYWLLLQAIIDLTFYPIDGPKHCKQAYEAEADEDFYTVRNAMIALLALIATGSCIVIIIPIYIYHLVKFFRNGR